MLNIEYWKDKLIKIREAGDVFAVLGGKPCSCNCLECGECDFNSADCEEEAINWLCSEYKEPEIDWDNDIDWMKVPVDTEVLVSDSCGMELRLRKFVVYLPNTFYGKYITFTNGETQYDAKGVCSWACCKLVKPEDIEKYRKR